MQRREPRFEPTCHREATSKGEARKRFKTNGNNTVGNPRDVERQTRPGEVSRKRFLCANNKLHPREEETGPRTLRDIVGPAEVKKQPNRIRSSTGRGTQREETGTAEKKPIPGVKADGQNSLGLQKQKSSNRIPRRNETTVRGKKCQRVDRRRDRAMGKRGIGTQNSQLNALLMTKSRSQETPREAMMGEEQSAHR